jgi:hypothetical protein
MMKTQMGMGGVDMVAVEEVDVATLGLEGVMVVDTMMVL